MDAAQERVIAPGSIFPLPTSPQSAIESVAVVGIAQVEIRFTMDSQRVENVFHVLAGSPLTQAEADAIFGVVDSWIKTVLRPRQAATAIYREVYIKDVNAGAPAAFTYPGDGLPGTRAGVAASNLVTFSLKKNTGVAGRKYRGRFYHIGLGEDDYIINVVNAADVLALVSVYQSLRTSLATASHNLLVAYRDYTLPGHPVVGGIEVTSITAADSIVDAQRRRLPGRGR